MRRLTQATAGGRWRCFLLLGFLCFGWLALRAADLPRQANLATNRYEFRPAHDPAGIGKFYLGREIAQVMGHEAADWLERPERVTSAVAWQEKWAPREKF